MNVSRIKIPKLILAVFFMFGLVFQIQSQGYLVPNGIITNLFAGEIDLNWPAETQVNGFEFIPAGKTSGLLAYTNIFTFTEPVTIGVRVFLVSPNQPFTSGTITSNSYAEISDPTGQNVTTYNHTFNLNSPFYVALYSGASWTQDYWIQFQHPPPWTNYMTYTDPVFGWAELENQNGVITLLDGALAYGADGIYVGTQNIIQSVPEPSAFAFIGSGAIGIFLFHSRRRF